MGSQKRRRTKVKPPEPAVQRAGRAFGIWASLGVAIAFSLMLGDAKAACEPGGKGDMLVVRKSSSARIEVCLDTVLRDALPAELFGFNVHHHHFERDFWNKRDRSVDQRVVSALKELPGAVYRYPGGLIANRFDWSQAIGDIGERKPQLAVKWADPDVVHFGLAEFSEFTRSVDGTQIYVLNLVGSANDDLFHEDDAASVAARNAALASYRKELLGCSPGTPRLYELGNELDRADYQWPHDKYVSRARQTIDAIREVDREAQFIAFLREFDWVYRGEAASRGISRSADFISDVLTRLPEVNDFSMHFYYDHPRSEKISQTLPWRLDRFRAAISAATDAKKGTTPGVWITEHARGVPAPPFKAKEVKRFTSNLSAAVSTADFLIALAQMPAVRGATWHGLNALPWQLFDPQKDLEPTTVYWLFRMLRESVGKSVYATYSSSPDKSGYNGGYDVRAVALASNPNEELDLWIVNRSRQVTPVEIRIAQWGDREVRVAARTLSAPAGVDPDSSTLGYVRVVEQPDTTRRAGATGVVELALAPSSVSRYRLSPLR